MLVNADEGSKKIKPNETKDLVGRWLIHTQQFVLTHR